MKRIFILFTIVAWAFNSYGKQVEDENTFVFSYSTDNIVSSVGYSNTFVRVAFMIPKEVAAKYTGAEITKIHVGFGSSSATSTSVFIAEGLTGTSVKRTQTAKFNTLAWNVVTLDEPYIITGNADILVGYEFKGSSSNFYSIGLDDSNAPHKYGNYYCVKTGVAYSAWANLADQGYYNAALKATIQSDHLPQCDLVLNSVSANPVDLLPGESALIKTVVSNYAIAAITHFKITYEIGSEVMVDNMDIAIAPFKEVTISKEVVLDKEGVYPVKVSVSEPNGKQDEDASDNLLSAKVDLWVGAAIPTIPRNRNAVIEEYTGIHCTWCPEGHKIANELKHEYPGHVEIINIHQGIFAVPGAGEPDFRTEWGDALANQTGLTGYPSGTVSRHVFSGGKTVMDRANWRSAAEQLMNENSAVNLLSTATIDWNTRELTVKVNGYYTADSKKTTNMLNVALLQENILGPQTNGSIYPEMMEGKLYRHNHMLRELLTGQWGDPILTTTAGASFEKTYTYSIPEKFNDIPVNLNNLTVVAFVTEDKQEIITGTASKIQPVYFEKSIIQLVELEQVIHQTDDNQILVQAVIQNVSQEPLTSYQLQYTVDGNATATYQATGKNLQLFEKDTIHLPLLPITLGEDKTLTVSVQQANGVPVLVPSELSLAVRKNVHFAKSRSLQLRLWQDRYGSEISWKLFDPEGEVFAASPVYTDLTGNTTRLHTVDWTVPENGVYRFDIYDNGGNGINGGYGAGKYEIWVGDNCIASDDGKYGAKSIRYISVTDKTGIHSPSVVYMNAYSFEDNLYIYSSSPIAYVAVYDLLGKQLIFRKNGVDSMPLSGLSKGIYLVKLVTQAGEEKIVKINK